MNLLKSLILQIGAGIVIFGFLSAVLSGLYEMLKERSQRQKQNRNGDEK